MAVRIVSNSGGTWTTTTTWVGGVVPVAGDTIEFTPTSGPLTINSAVICAGINFTNYLNTITFTNDLTIQGPINLGSGGYTQAGSNGLLVNSNAGGTGFTSNGVTWVSKFTLGGGGTAATYVFLDDWNFTGNLLMSNTNTMTLNGPGNIKTSNLTKTSTSVVTGSSNIIFNGNGTWSHTAAGYIQNNVIIDTSSTLTIGTNIYYQNGILTYSGGTVTTTSSTLTIGGNTTLNTNGIIWNNVSTPNAGTITIVSDFTISNISNFRTGGGTLSFISSGGNLICNGDLYLGTSGTININTTTNLPNNLTVNNLYFYHYSNGNSSGGAVRSLTINNSTITVLSNLSLNYNNSVVPSSGLINGTTNIVLNGSGSWTHTFTSPSYQLYLGLNTTINNFTIGTNVYYSSAILTYSAGTVNTLGSTLNLGGSTTLNVDGMSWNNVIMVGSQTLTSNLNINGNLTTQTSAVSINGLFNVNVGGNLTISTLTSGNATIILNGSGTQTWSTSSYLSNNLTINKIGDLNLSSNIYYQSGVMVYSGGTVITTGNTLNIGSSCTLSTDGVTWNNVIIGSTSTITLNSNFVWNGTLSLLTVSSGTLTFNGTGLLNPTLLANISLGNENYGGGGIGNSIINFPTSSVLSITNLSVRCGGASNTAYNTTANNVTFNISGNLTMTYTNQGISRFNGTSSQVNMVGNGTITTNRTIGPGLGYISIPFNVNTSGTITLSSNVNSTVYFEATTITYTSGTISGVLTSFITGCNLNLNAGGQWGTSVNIQGNATLISDATFGNLQFSTTNSVLSGAFNINVKGNLTILTTTSGASTIIINGSSTGQTWTSTSYLSNNLTIDNSGNTLTLGQNVYYNTGTLKYISGVVDWNTNNATLNINSATSFDTNTLDLKNVSITGSIAYDITLNSEMNIVGLLKVLGTSTNRIRIKSNSSGVKRLLTLKPTATQNIKYTNALDIDSSLGYTVYSYRGNSILNTDNWQITNDLYFIGFTNSNYSNTNSWSTYSGGVPAEIIPDSTTNVIFDSNSSVNCIVDVASVAGTLNFLTYPSNRNITFNTNLTCSGNVTLGQNTESSNGTGNLVVNTSSVLTSNGYNFSAPMTLNGTSATYGFNGEWTSTSAVTFSNNITLSGSNLNISGGLLVNAAITVSGSKIILKNGTWSHTAAGYITNNIDIVPEVGNTLSLGANLYYRTGTINYINSGGTINAGSSILNINSNCSLNTSGMTWNRIDILSSSVLTLLSDLNSTTFYASYATNFSGPTRVVNVTNFYAGNNITTYSSGSIITITIGNVLNTVNITYYSNLSSGFGIYQGTIINGGVLNVTGNITLTPNASHAGNTPINWYPTNGSTLLNQGSYLRCDLNIYGTTNTAYISGSLYFDTKTLTYYSGNIITTGSTLYMYTGTANGYVSGPTQLNTSGMTWNNVVFGDQGGNTINLLSPITITGTTTLSSNSTLTVNGSDIIVKGNLTFTGGGNQRGNSKIYLTGSGTWTHPGGGYIINNVYIDTPGSYTISGNIRIGNTIGTTTSLIYINGSIDALNATLTIPPINGLSSLTLDTSTIIWGGLNCSYVSANSYEILNLLSHLNVFDITMSSSLSFTGVGILSVFRDIFIGRTGLTYNDGSTPTLTLPNNLMIRNLTLYGNGTYIFGNVPYGTAINNNTLTITGNITMSTTQFANTVHSGTSNIVWKTDGGTISQINSSFFHYNLTIDSPGIVNFSGTILYGGSKTLNYVRGKVNSKDSTFYLTGGCTLLNLNKLIFNNVTITSGSNIVMNEFFSGNLNKVTTISPSSTTNYTITFQDGFEKFTKFVKISRATISRISQLTVVTNGGNNGNNIGIKFYPNQLSSGLPKNTPSIPLESNYGVNGLLVDPSLDLQ